MTDEGERGRKQRWRGSYSEHCLSLPISVFTWKVKHPYNCIRPPNHFYVVCVTTLNQADGKATWRESMSQWHFLSTVLKQTLRGYCFGIRLCRLSPLHTCSAQRSKGGRPEICKYFTPLHFDWKICCHVGAYFAADHKTRTFLFGRTQSIFQSPNPLK